MKAPARPVSLITIYLGWVACLEIARKSYPDPISGFFVSLGLINTGVVVLFWHLWQKLYNDKVDDESDQSFSEWVHDIHIPFLDVKECSRCAGFYAGLISSATISALVLTLRSEIIESSWGIPISVVGFILFMFGMVVHGLLNGANKRGWIDIDGRLFYSSSKWKAGIIGGIGFCLIIVGGLSTNFTL